LGLDLRHRIHCCRPDRIGRDHANVEAIPDGDRHRHRLSFIENPQHAGIVRPTMQLGR
jgi:hypothetical protein